MFHFSHPGIVFTPNSPAVGRQTLPELYSAVAEVLLVPSAAQTGLDL